MTSQMQVNGKVFIVTKRYVRIDSDSVYCSDYFDGPWYECEMLT